MKRPLSARFTPFSLSLAFLCSLVTPQASGQLTLDDCFPPPTQEGNAADDYAYVLENLKWNELVLSATPAAGAPGGYKAVRDGAGRAEYNLDHPLLDRIVAGADKEISHFYPDHCAFPEIGRIDEIEYPDTQLAYDVATALCVRGMRACRESDFDSAHRDIRAAYWFGRHLKEEYATLGQTFGGMMIMVRACRDFAGLAQAADPTRPNYYAMLLIVKEHSNQIRQDMRDYNAPWPAIEDAEKAANVLAPNVGPPWYWPRIMMLAGPFARILTKEYPEEDFEIVSLPETFAFYLIDRSNRLGGYFNPDAMMEQYREHAPQIIKHIEGIHANPVSPFQHELARQVLEGDRNNFIGLAGLIKGGTVANGPVPRR